MLVRWSAANAKLLVLLIDEIDSLVGDSLIAVLRQIRAGYDRRLKWFPQSVILCGVYDVRDYRIRSRTEGGFVTGGSAFHIKAESLRLGDFSEREVRALLAQHEAETGQAFAEDAMARVWELTCGQPWLKRPRLPACFKDRTGASARSTPSPSENAKESLILDRVTHLDQPADKLQEGRVRRVIEPLLADANQDTYTAHDLEYLRDLGLVARDAPLRVANPIYAEVVPRELTFVLQDRLADESAWYVDADRNSDLCGLLEAFQDFFRQHSEHWVKRFGYEQAGPQLMLQAAGGEWRRAHRTRVRFRARAHGPADPVAGPCRMRKRVVECKRCGLYD